MLTRDGGMVYLRGMGPGRWGTVVALCGFAIALVTGERHPAAQSVEPRIIEITTKMKRMATRMVLKQPIL